MNIRIRQTVTRLLIRLVDLALPFFIGFLLAALIPSLVRAQSQLEFGGVHRTSASYITAPLVDEPAAYIEPYTIHATNGFTVHYVPRPGIAANRPWAGAPLTPKCRMLWEPLSVEMKSG